VQHTRFDQIGTILTGLGECQRNTDIVFYYQLANFGGYE